MMIVRFLMTAVLVGLTCGLLEFANGNPALAQEKKKEKDPQEGKKGIVVGTLTMKGENYIELKLPGEEKARKYVPRWKGGAPSAGGSFDKEVLKVLRDLKIGSRLEVEWVFEERLRVLGVKILKTSEPEKK